MIFDGFQTAKHLRAVQLFEIWAEFFTDTQINGHVTDDRCLADAALRVLKTLPQQTDNTVIHMKTYYESASYKTSRNPSHVTYTAKL